MKQKQYFVIYEDNGGDCFLGTYEECEDYIARVQVGEYGRSAEEFGIYEAP